MIRLSQPANSPKPAARPEHCNLELTVPEPSLINEWNSKLTMSSESSSDEAVNENDMVVSRDRASSTQLAEKSSVRFNLREDITQIKQRSAQKKSNKLPEDNTNNSSSHQMSTYFQSVENIPNASHFMNQPFPHPAYQNGTLELIEVIRKQEIEIHKYKRSNNKYLKKLKTHDQIMKAMRDRLEHLEALKLKNEELNQSSYRQDTFTQTDPIPTKRTRDNIQQTSFSRDPEAQTSAEVVDEVTPPPLTNGSTQKLIENQERSMNSRDITPVYDDEDTDSDKELSPEDLQKLIAEINESKIRRKPKENNTEPIERHCNAEEQELPSSIDEKNVAHETQILNNTSEQKLGEIQARQKSDDTIYIEAVAPSYGAQYNFRHSQSIVVDESICGRMAQKYGIPNGSDRKVSPEDYSTGEMSIATANYLYRHGLHQGPPHTKPRFGSSPRKDMKAKNKKSLPSELINFEDLEKIQKYI